MLIITILWATITVVALIGLIISYKELQRSRKLLIRNEEVGAFRTRINTMSYTYNIRHKLSSGECKDDAYEWFYDKFDYDDMLFSDKPLTLEAWYTKEEIIRINS